MTHFVEFDRVRRGRKSIALCGDFVDERDISSDPTCEECQRQLTLTAEDVFGTAEDAREFGPPVPTSSSQQTATNRRNANRQRRPRSESGKERL